MNKVKIHRSEEYYTLWGRELEDKILIDFWTKLSNSSVARFTFYEYLPKNAEEFCGFVKSNSQDVRFVGKDENLLAMYWLNNQLGKAVMIHFCLLKQAFNQQLSIGKYVVSSLLLAENQGEEVISALMGLTPKPYRHAINFIQKLGFEIVAVLAKSCHFKAQNKYVDGVVSILTIKNLRKH